MADDPLIDEFGMIFDAASSSSASEEDISAAKDESPFVLHAHKLGLK